MTDLFIDNPPADEAVIVELHAWIATAANGGEGIVSADVPMPGLGLRHVPLLSSERRIAMMMEDLARRAVAAAIEATGEGVTLELVTFRRVSDG